MFTRTKVKEELQRLIDSILVRYNEGYKGDERNTVIKFISPIFNLLGWDTIEDIEFEYKIKRRSADIALMVSSTPEILIEVEPLDTELSDTSAAQAAAYLHAEGVRWGIVTNGREIRSYDRKFMPKKGKKGRELFKLSFEGLKKLDKKSYERFFDILFLLSKEKVSKGILNHIGDRFLKKYREVKNRLEKIGVEIPEDEKRRLAVHQIIKETRSIPFHKKIELEGWSRNEIANFLRTRNKKSLAFFEILTKNRTFIKREDIGKKMAEHLKISKIDTRGIAGFRAPLKKLGKEDVIEEKGDSLKLKDKYRGYFEACFRS